jgi:hypothetical protein
MPQPWSVRQKLEEKIHWRKLTSGMTCRRLESTRQPKKIGWFTLITRFGKPKNNVFTEVMQKKADHERRHSVERQIPRCVLEAAT